MRVNRGAGLFAAVAISAMAVGCAVAETEVAAVVLEQDEEVTRTALPPPLVLDAGVSDVGISHVFEDDGVELGSGQVLEVDPVTRSLVADALVDDGHASCRVTLAAPPDRGLVARGELAVTLVLDGRDGETRRVPRPDVAVDAAVPPGDRRELAAGPAIPVDIDATRVVSCEAVHQPD